MVIPVPIGPNSAQSASTCDEYAHAQLALVCIFGKRVLSMCDPWGLSGLMESRKVAELFN